MDYERTRIDHATKKGGRAPHDNAADRRRADQRRTRETPRQQRRGVQHSAGPTPAPTAHRHRADTTETSAASPGGRDSSAATPAALPLPTATRRSPTRISARHRRTTRADPATTQQTPRPASAARPARRRCPAPQGEPSTACTPRCHLRRPRQTYHRPANSPTATSPPLRAASRTYRNALDNLAGTTGLAA